MSICDLIGARQGRVLYTAVTVQLQHAFCHQHDPQGFKTRGVPVRLFVINANVAHM